MEEDIKILNNIKSYMQDNIDKGYHKFTYNDLGCDEKCVDIINAIENLINRNKELEEENIHWKGQYHLLSRKINVIPKSKVEEKYKWKPISEYDNANYDWVLVKYFDGDYECVPEVAEKRSDGKWYTDEKEIPFEVKYFFDMQELLGDDN